MVKFWYLNNVLQIIKIRLFGRMSWLMALLSNHRGLNMLELEQISTLIQIGYCIGLYGVWELIIRRLHASTGMSSGLIPAMRLSVSFLFCLFMTGPCPQSWLNHTFYSIWHWVWYKHVDKGDSTTLPLSMEICDSLCHNTAVHVLLMAGTFRFFFFVVDK